MTENNETTTDSILNSGKFNNRDEIQTTIKNLILNTNREFLILGPALDPFYFNNSDFISALTTFVTGHQRNTAKILIENNEQIIRDNGRLTALCRKLHENLRIRSLPEEYQGHTELMIISDQQTVLLQHNLDRPDITLSVADRTFATTYARRFEYAWQRSVPMPGLRTLGL